MISALKKSKDKSKKKPKLYSEAQFTNAEFYNLYHELKPLVMKQLGPGEEEDPKNLKTIEGKKFQICTAAIIRRYDYLATKKNSDLDPNLDEKFKLYMVLDLGKDEKKKEKALPQPSPPLSQKEFDKVWVAQGKMLNLRELLPPRFFTKKAQNNGEILIQLTGQWFKQGAIVDDKSSTLPQIEAAQDFLKKIEIEVEKLFQEAFPELISENLQMKDKMYRLVQLGRGVPKQRIKPWWKCFEGWNIIRDEAEEIFFQEYRREQIDLYFPITSLLDYYYKKLDAWRRIENRGAVADPANRIETLKFHVLFSVNNHIKFPDKDLTEEQIVQKLTKTITEKYSRRLTSPTSAAEVNNDLLTRVESLKLSKKNPYRDPNDRSEIQEIKAIKIYQKKIQTLVPGDQFILIEAEPETISSQAPQIAAKKAEKEVAKPETISLSPLQALQIATEEAEKEARGKAEELNTQIRKNSTKLSDEPEADPDQPEEVKVWHKRRAELANEELQKQDILDEKNVSKKAKKHVSFFDTNSSSKSPEIKPPKLIYTKRSSKVVNFNSTTMSSNSTVLNFNPTTMSSTSTADIISLLKKYNAIVNPKNNISV